MPIDSNYPGILKREIDTPALLVDLDILESNIARMAMKLEGKRARLRPHYKTHKTPAIALKQIEAGAIGITCAKVEEAETLVNAGIKDILIANQVIGPRKIARLAGLARHADLMVAVDDAGNVDDLSSGVTAAGSTLRVLAEVNVGNNRCGVAPGEAAVALARRIADAPGLVFAGVMGYEGFAQRIPDFQERKATVERAMAALLETARLIEASGLPVGIVSGGGTGTHEIQSEIEGITEIQAGTYVVMDVDYRNLGIDFGCALTVLTTVISTPRPGVVITDAGMKSMTTDHGMPEVRGVPGAKLTKLSEEHGTIVLEDSTATVRVGDRIEIIPSHACTTMNLHDHLYGIRGDRLEVVWPIAGRGKAR